MFGSGRVRFRPSKFGRALGEEVGREYRNGLDQIVPDAMRMEYPRVEASAAAKVAPALFELVKKAIEDVEPRTDPIVSVEG